MLRPSCEVSRYAPLAGALALLFVACNEPSEVNQPAVTASAITAGPPAYLRLEKREAHRARIDNLKKS